jgi:hypothetical protein
MSFDLERAKSFVSEVELPDRPRGPVAQGPDDKPIYETVKSQATIVGSDVISFVTGVEDTLREAISDASLLAQLHANEQVDDEEDIYQWYNVYFDVLSNIGWSIQDKGFTDYTEKFSGFEVHEKIISVATVLLGDAPSALAVLTSTVNALKEVDSEAGWIKIFKRETQQAKAGRFQITLVEQADDGILITLMAFGLKAKKVFTQVLFFKVKKHKATLRVQSSKVSVNVQSVRDLSVPIRNKVRDYQQNYVAALLK